MIDFMPIERTNYSRYCTCPL